MKQIIFLTAAVFFSGMNCFGQNESKFKSVKDNIAKNDAATQHPKKGIDPKTWMDRGKLFQEAYGVNVNFLRFGMGTLEAIMYFKEPKQKLSSEEGGVTKETWEYSQINLNFENDMLKSWEEIQTVVDTPLSEAVNAYKQATSLDEKGKNAKKINEAYKFINIDLESKFFNEINLLKYKESYSTALLRIDVSKLLGFSDTTYYFYAGYAAMAQSEIDSSMWQSAVDNFEKAVSLKYREIGEFQGQIYGFLCTSYIKTGNSEKALKIAQSGFEKYPGNEQLLYALINFYLNSDPQQCLEYLDQAVARDPRNAKLLFAKGKVLEELGEKEKSMAAYLESIAADPDLFDPYYNIAVGYHNSAVKILDEINENTKLSVAEYEAGKNEADEVFFKAVPFMEKAHVINPESVETMEVLRTLYYRLKAKHPEMEAKYEKILQKLGK